MLERRDFIEKTIGAVLGSTATSSHPSDKLHQLERVKGENLKAMEPVKVQIEFKRPPQIRVWKLGDLEHKLFPSAGAVNKLAEQLKGWDGNSDLDIIWGPDLKVDAINVSTGDIDVVQDEQGRHIIVKGLSNVSRFSNS